MLQSRPISLFRISIILVLNLYFNNKLLLIFSVVLLLIDNYKSLIIFAVIFIITCFVNNHRIDYMKYGIVDEIVNNYSIVDKGFYKVKTYNTIFEIGDIVYFLDKSELNDNDYDLSRNILFINNSKCIKKNSLYVRKWTYRRLNSFNEEVSAYLKKTLINDNDNQNIEYLGYGFYFYYLLIAIRKRNAVLSYLLILLYTLFFGFDIKFILLLLDIPLLLFDINRLDKLSLKLIFIILINHHLLYNYSILISLLFSFYYLTDLKDDKFYIGVFQSLFFNEVQLFTTFFYKYLIYIRIFLFIISLFVLIFAKLSTVYLVIVKVISKVLILLNFSIRGKISIFVLVTIFIIIYKFRITNQYIKLLILISVLVLPINNPLKHVTFINVGQGDSCLIRGALNSYNILIDTGSTYNYSKLRKYLMSEGIYRIDYLIITHDDNDHSGNIDNLNKDFIVNDMVTIGKDIVLDNDYLKYLNIGQYDNSNDNSLVYLLNIDGYDFLFTGDISKNVENNIVTRHNIRNIDVLKVSHHGSNSASSSYFIGSLLPKYGVISTSGAYNHPHKEVIDCLNAYYVNILTTKDYGNISFYFTNLFDFIKTSNNQFAIIES